MKKLEYTALYRKFRPLTFDEIVGQEHIVRTLKNEIINGRIGHAYLFNGGRGTGKTSAAKILARAVNCLNPKDGEPCNECEICKAALDGSLTDIVEMDAASNNSVEDVRAIRDEVNFLPTVAKYRVYIIDEVHMLSTGAFNALLKTLEEPPAHVKFILATTEPQKLPATILSRCQRFDFKKISNADIEKRLNFVCKESKIDITDEAKQLIAVLAEGAMRDALSILERCLQEAQAQRFRIVVTDGVFSMDGNVAPMDQICDLAEKYDALVMVDESHSAGVVGATGHGVSELYKTYGRVDIYTGTLGKAFGGALGGFTTGRKEIIDLLRQRSRPYLFSNSLAPGIIGASLEVFKMLKESNALHDKLVENVNYFRDQMTAAGFDIKPTQSAICAVMLYDAKLSQIYAARMQEEGIYVTGFYYPVVPKEQARIRVQISAGHEKAHLDKCIAAFIKVGKELGTLK